MPLLYLHVQLLYTTGYAWDRWILILARPRLVLYLYAIDEMCAVIEILLPERQDLILVVPEIPMQLYHTPIFISWLQNSETHWKVCLEARSNATHEWRTRRPLPADAGRDLNQCSYIKRLRFFTHPPHCLLLLMLCRPSIVLRRWWTSTIKFLRCLYQPVYAHLKSDWGYVYVLIPLLLVQSNYPRCMMIPNHNYQAQQSNGPSSSADYILQSWPLLLLSSMSVFGRKLIKTFFIDSLRIRMLMGNLSKPETFDMPSGMVAIFVHAPSFMSIV